MISINYEIDFKLENSEVITDWISRVIDSENCSLGDINYVFCSDEYLHDINLKFLNHDTYTDIISFDYSVGKELHGDIYISIDRVLENAKTFDVSFQEELHRVMIHGILHYCGYKDKSDEEVIIMRSKENSSLDLLSRSL